MRESRFPSAPLVDSPGAFPQWNHRGACPRQNQSGVCLVEVLIALAAGAVVLSATLQSLHHFDVRLSAQQVAAARLQDLRIGLQVLDGELRLAGTGAAAQESAILQAEPEAVTVLVNLDGRVTRTLSAVSGTEDVLPVGDGADWPKGKRVVVCWEARCAESWLARAGRRRELKLTAPLGQAFPAGSRVFVSNRVRYYLSADRRGRRAVMRQVDGGANPLVGEVSRFHLAYKDPAGHPTADPVRVARVRVEIAVEGGPALIREVGLRTHRAGEAAGSGS
ncbi:PilW family protein [Nitrospira sp. Kam-Ns4a]